MKQKESWALMLGYPEVPLQAKRLYWLLDRIADKDWTVATTNKALSRLTGKGVEMIGRYLQSLRTVGLIENLEKGVGRYASRYHLLPPDLENEDYLEAVELLKKASRKKQRSIELSKAKKSKNKPSACNTTTLSSSSITCNTKSIIFDGLTLSKTARKEILKKLPTDVLGKYIKEDVKLRSKPISKWNTFDFINLSKWLYEKEFKKPCLVLTMSRSSKQSEKKGKIISRFKTDLIRRFKDHGMTEIHVVSFLIWLMKNKKNDIKEFHALVGIICSEMYQQEWVEWDVETDDGEDQNMKEKYLDSMHCIRADEIIMRPWEQYWDKDKPECRLCPNRQMCEGEAGK